jgi:rod shape-determining protein MreB
MFGLGTEIGIDLGTASVLVFIKGKGIVLQEPSVVAIDRDTGRVLAVGSEARKMLGRTPGNIVAIRPLKDGVISDYEVTEKMLRHFINKTCGPRRFIKPKIIICVPSGVTEVEKRAVIDATIEAGGGKTFLIEEPIAAAVGAGLDITKPDGNMIIDIGGGTADIAVISLGGIVVSKSIKVAGDKFDEAIIKYMRKAHNLLIGERTAEELKIEIGTASPRPKPVTMDCRGRDLITGLPKNITVSSEEMLEALREPVNAISDAVHSVLEKTPPELASDISSRGIVMTGGGSLLHGLNRMLEKRTGIPTYIAEDAISCVAKGTGMALEHIDILEKSMMTQRRR